MLLPPGLVALARTRLLLTEAVRATKGAPMTSLWSVVELLEAQGEDDASDIAAYLRDMAELPLARLFFPTGSVDDPEGVGEQTLTVLTMPGLILPPPGVSREHWSTSEQLAVPLLHLACWYATRAIYGRPRVERKLIALDETHFLADWGAGRSLFTRLGRDSRKWNTCVLAASQNPSDVLGMEVSNFISSAFVGRIEDDEVAADALRMLRIPAGVGYESVLARLSPRGAPGERSRIREFVMRDVDGNVDRMRVDLDHLPELLEALDTTARPHERDLPLAPPSGRADATAPWDMPALPAAQPGVQTGGTQHDGTQHDGTQHDGTQTDRVRTGAVRHDGTQSDGVQHDGSPETAAVRRSAASAGWARKVPQGDQLYQPQKPDYQPQQGEKAGPPARTDAKDGEAPPGADGQGVHVA
jgi:hypothetical protein